MTTKLIFCKYLQVNMRIVTSSISYFRVRINIYIDIPSTFPWLSTTWSPVKKLGRGFLALTKLNGQLVTQLYMHRVCKYISPLHSMTFHDLSMTFPWPFHDHSMTFSQLSTTFSGLSKTFPWLSTIFPRPYHDFHDLSMNFPWSSYDLSITFGNISQRRLKIIRILRIEVVCHDLRV